MAASLISVLIVEKLLGFGLQYWQIVLDSFPDSPMIDCIVTVDQAISELDCLLTGTNSQERLRVFRAQSHESFTDYLEFALHGRTQHFVLKVIAESLAGSKLFDILAGGD